MPVLDLCSVQALDSGTSYGSEPVAYDKLVILHHIGSLCVSTHSNTGPEPAKASALFPSASTGMKANALSEGVSEGSIPVIPVKPPTRK